MNKIELILNHFCNEYIKENEDIHLNNLLSSFYLKKLNGYMQFAQYAFIIVFELHAWLSIWIKYWWLKQFESVFQCYITKYVFS